MLSDRPGRKLETYIPDYVLFDLETTGISCETDDVIEISAVKVVGGKIVDEFSTLVTPGRPIPAQASAVNGITDEMVRNSPRFDAALRDFLEFAGDSVLVGHNVQMFDLKFIRRDAKRYFGKQIGNDFIDTLQIARAYLPDISSHRLTALAGHYGIQVKEAHRALGDCRMNQQVFEKLRFEMDNPSEAAKKVKKCPICGNVLRKRSGQFGDFLGCASYPDCRYTENISGGKAND